MGEFREVPQTFKVNKMIEFRANLQSADTSFPFERVLAAAHRHLTSVAREMNGLMWDPYMATAKGDARYYLRTHPQAVAS